MVSRATRTPANFVVGKIQQLTSNGSGTFSVMNFQKTIPKWTYKKAADGISGDKDACQFCSGQNTATHQQRQRHVLCNEFSKDNSQMDLQKGSRWYLGRQRR